MLWCIVPANHLAFLRRFTKIKLTIDFVQEHEAACLKLIIEHRLLSTKEHQIEFWILHPFAGALIKELRIAARHCRDVNGLLELFLLPIFVRLSLIDLLFLNSIADFFFCFCTDLLCNTILILLKCRIDSCICCSERFITIFHDPMRREQTIDRQSAKHNCRTVNLRKVQTRLCICQDKCLRIVGCGLLILILNDGFFCFIDTLLTVLKNSIEFSGSGTCQNHRTDCTGNTCNQQDLRRMCFCFCTELRQGICSLFHHFVFH